MKRLLTHTALAAGNRRNRRRGAAATEAAIVLPVLLTLVLGAIDFGRVFGLAAELSNAARVGAESGATHRPTSYTYASWESRIQTVILDELTDANRFDPGKVTIDIVLTTDVAGNQRVEVTVQYLFSTIVKWPFLPTQVPLNATASMRQYR